MRSNAIFKLPGNGPDVLGNSDIQTMHAEIAMLRSQVMQCVGFRGPAASGEYTPAGMRILAGEFPPDTAVTAGD